MRYEAKQFKVVERHSLKYESEILREHHFLLSPDSSPVRLVEHEIDGLDGSLQCLSAHHGFQWLTHTRLEKRT
jgi:hypothetical protein